MKKLLSAVLAAAIFAPTTAQANDQLASSICSYIETDNKSRLRKVLKENKVRIRNIHESIVCGGQPMLRFAITKDAQSVGTFIVSKISASALSQPSTDGLNVVDWAANGGHGGSPIVANVKNKIAG